MTELAAFPLYVYPPNDSQPSWHQCYNRGRMAVEGERVFSDAAELSADPIRDAAYDSLGFDQWAELAAHEYQRGLMPSSEVDGRIATAMARCAERGYDDTEVRQAKVAILGDA